MRGRDTLDVSATSLIDKRQMLRRPLPGPRRLTLSRFLDGSAPVKLSHGGPDD
jgi:hypothetical protein